MLGPLDRSLNESKFQALVKNRRELLLVTLFLDLTRTDPRCPPRERFLCEGLCSVVAFNFFSYRASLVSERVTVSLLSGQILYHYRISMMQSRFVFFIE